MVDIDSNSMSQQIGRFLVRPKDSFVSRLQLSNSEFAPILLESTLWSEAFGIRIAIDWKEYGSVLKRLHIAQLLAEFGNNEDLRALVGRLAVSVECVDKLWELIEVDCEESVDYVFSKLPQELRDKVGRYSSRPSS